jgi:hypothetical protein
LIESWWYEDMGSRSRYCHRVCVADIDASELFADCFDYSARVRIRQVAAQLQTMYHTASY